MFPSGYEAVESTSRFLLTWVVIIENRCRLVPRVNRWCGAGRDTLSHVPLCHVPRAAVPPPMLPIVRC